MPRTRTCPPALAVVAALLLGLGLAACTDERSPPGVVATTSSAPPTAGPGAAAGAAGADNRVEVDMAEYRFGVTGGLVAGTGTIGLRNSGTEMHMAAFGLLRPGRTLADARTALASEDAGAYDAVFAADVDAPGAILSPGQSQELTTDVLGAGTYALMCFIPTAGEATPVPHLAKGMLATLVVAPGAAKADATIPAGAEYRIGDGSIQGPTSLPAGRTTLRMTSGGTGPHEFFVVRTVTPTTTYADVDAYFTELFEGLAAPPKGYADTAPGVITASTFDVASGRSVLVSTTLVPGHYLIGCASEDASGDRASQHAGEILQVTVT